MDKLEEYIKKLSDKELDIISDWRDYVKNEKRERNINKLKKWMDKHEGEYYLTNKDNKYVGYKVLNNNLILQFLYYDNSEIAFIHKDGLRYIPKPEMEIEEDAFYYHLRIAFKKLKIFSLLSIDTDSIVEDMREKLESMTDGWFK